MRRHSTYDREGYPLRIMLCTVASLLIMIALFRFWPRMQPSQPTMVDYQAQEQELVLLEEISPTRHTRQQKPPPPAPLPPVLVPDDVILEQEELQITDSYLPITDPGDDAAQVEGAPEGSNTALASSYVSPKPRRLAEPEYTREARRKRIRAEIVVEVLVDEAGHVQDTRVVERFLLGDSEAKEAVEAIGYGLEEAALTAAERWLFRPARKNGKPVSSYATLTFRFGV